MTSHSLGKGQGFSTLCSSCDFGPHTKQVVEEVAGGPASAVLYFTEVQVHVYVFSVSASDVYPSLSLPGHSVCEVKNFHLFKITLFKCCCFLGLK